VLPFGAFAKLKLQGLPLSFDALASLSAALYKSFFTPV